MAFILHILFAMTYIAIAAFYLAVLFKINEIDSIGSDPDAGVLIIPALVWPIAIPCHLAFNFGKFCFDNFRKLLNKR